MADKIKEIYEKHIEWNLYKVLYIGILVPLLFGEARNWVFQDFSVAIVLFATAIILLLPLIFKFLTIIKFIEGIQK
jgi:hypothetical protein